MKQYLKLLMIFIPGLLPLLPGQTFNALNDAPDSPHFRVELRDLHPEGSQGSRFTLSLTDLICMKANT
jgi:hypothetical protein